MVIWKIKIVDISFKSISSFIIEPAAGMNENETKELLIH